MPPTRGVVSLPEPRPLPRGNIDGIVPFQGGNDFSVAFTAIKRSFTHHCGGSCASYRFCAPFRGFPAQVVAFVHHFEAFLRELSLSRTVAGLSCAIHRFYALLQVFSIGQRDFAPRVTFTKTGNIPYRFATFCKYPLPPYRFLQANRSSAGWSVWFRTFRTSHGPRFVGSRHKFFVKRHD